MTFAARLLFLSALYAVQAQHRTHFVSVEKDVQLEVLEWPGSGRAVVLLAGSGNTAHVFEEFAPKLSGCCHVYAITRRGFGHSSHPENGYTDQRLADDVLQVLNGLAIEKPVLIGHSMAGGELTTLGVQHSGRLSGLVYLDAGADPADFPWSDAAYRDAVNKLTKLSPAKPSAMAPHRNASIASYRAWQRETAGFVFCEAEIRNMYDVNADGSIGRYRTAQSIRQAIDRGSKKRDYADIRVPVLSIFATPPAIPGKDQEPELRAASVVENSIRLKFIRRYISALRAAVPTARILEWPEASHYLYLTQEADVLRELRAFIASLR